MLNSSRAPPQFRSSPSPSCSTTSPVACDFRFLTPYPYLPSCLHRITLSSILTDFRRFRSHRADQKSMDGMIRHWLFCSRYSSRAGFANEECRRMENRECIMRKMYQNTNQADGRSPKRELSNERFEIRDPTTTSFRLSMGIVSLACTHPVQCSVICINCVTVRRCASRIVQCITFDRHRGQKTDSP